MKRVRASRGFTLVELLIVIVVIAILAAITIVAYGGVTNKAHISAVQSTLKQATTQLDEYNVTNSGYPADQATAALKSSSDITLHYFKQSDGNNYCLEATEGSVVYAVTNQDNAPHQGDCSQAGLVSEWKLNGDASDAIGANNGVIAGATAGTGQDGKSGSALQFSGVSQNIKTTDAGFPTGNSDRSVFAWVNLTSLPTASWAMINSYGTTTSPNIAAAFALGITNNGNVGCVGSNDTYNSSGQITAGTWYLVGCIVSNNGATATPYINGTGYTGSFPTPLNTIVTGTDYVASYMTSNYYVNGSIDDVRIFDRALTAGEVQEMVSDGAL